MGDKRAPRRHRWRSERRKAMIGSSCRERLEAYLRDHGVPFETQQHRPAFTAQEVAASEHIPGQMLAKVVVVVADGRGVMLVLPTPWNVDLEKARDTLGADQLRLAAEEEFEGAFSDCEAGAMPPFGNLYGFPVYVDERLREVETIYFQAGTHTETMSLRYADFERLVSPLVADFVGKG